MKSSKRCPRCGQLSSHSIRCSQCRRFFPEFVRRRPSRPKGPDKNLQKQLQDTFACDFYLPVPLARPRGLGRNWRKRVIKLGRLKPKAEKPHTYTRSAMSKNHGEEFTPYAPEDPPLEWDSKNKKFKRARPIPANVSGFKNFLSTINVPDTLPSETRPSWSTDSFLYDQILRYQVRNCRFLAEQLRIPDVYVANDYPCLQIQIANRIKNKITGENYIKNFVEYAASILNGYIDFFAFQAGFAMPCVVRSSFGFLTPTTAETGESIRLSLGLAPKGYLLCVGKAIQRFLQDLDTFVSQELSKAVDVPFFYGEDYLGYRGLDKSKAPFSQTSTVLDYLTQKVDPKKGLLEDAQRTFSGTSLATQHCYEALAQQHNGFTEAVRALLDGSLWSLTGKKSKSLSFDAMDTVGLYEYDATALKPCNASSHEDTDFFELTNVLLQRTDSWYAPPFDDQFSRWKAAVFAAEEALLANLGTKNLVDDLEEDSGSDSEEEFDAPSSSNPKQRMLHIKLIAQNGMNAIAIALQCARFWLQDVVGRELHVIDKLPLDKLKVVEFDKKSFTSEIFTKKSTSKFATSKGSVSYTVKGGKSHDLDTSEKLLLTKSAQVKHNLVFQDRPELASIYLEQMYFEAPHLLDINRWTKRVDRLKGAEIVLMDANHCQTSRPSHIPTTSFVFDTVDLSKLDLAAHKVVVFDVTSATTEKMNQLIRLFTRGAKADALLMLVDSGLKHQQLGTDRNSYGTIRFICGVDHEDQVKTIMGEAKKLPAYRKQTVLSHSVRRAFKMIGATPTIKSILNPNRTSQHAMQHVSSPFPYSVQREQPKTSDDMKEILTLALELVAGKQPGVGLVQTARTTQGNFSQFDIPGAGSACSPIAILAIAELLKDPGIISPEAMNNLVIQGGAIYQGIIRGIEGVKMYASQANGLKGEKLLEGIHLNPYETPDAVLSQLALAWGGQQTCGRLSLLATLSEIFGKGEPVGVAIVIGGYTVSVSFVGGKYYLFDSHGFRDIKGAFVETYTMLLSVIERLQQMVEDRLPRSEAISISVFRRAH